MPSHRQLLAQIYEEEHGALPDPVTTFGAHLVDPPPTPCSLPYFDATFYTDAVHALRRLQSRSTLRARLYGAAADESRLAHTPPELKAQHQSDHDQNLRQWIRCVTPPTPSTPETDASSTFDRGQSLQSKATTPDSSTGSLVTMKQERDVKAEGRNEGAAIQAGNTSGHAPHAASGSTTQHDNPTTQTSKKRRLEDDTEHIEGRKRRRYDTIPLSSAPQPRGTKTIAASAFTSISISTSRKRKREHDDDQVILKEDMQPRISSKWKTRRIRKSRRDMGGVLRFGVCALGGLRGLVL